MTVLVYDDDYDEYGASYDYADGDPFNMNDLSVQLLSMKGLQPGQRDGAYNNEKRNKNHAHDKYLYRRWINPTVHKYKTKKPCTVPHAETPVTDDPSVTPTLETFYTLNTRSPHHTDDTPNTILSFTILNQPFVQYRIPNRPTTQTHNP